MATAKVETTKKPKLVEKVVQVKEVTLTLSVNEAEAIMSILYKVGGQHLRSPRRHTDRVMRALQDVGIQFPGYCGELRGGESYAEGRITFGEYPFTPEELA